MVATHPIPQWFTGSQYTYRVAASILKYGPVARTTLAERLGLSQGALSRITSDLIHEGVIAELPSATTLGENSAASLTLDRGRERRRGRPQTALVVRTDAKTFIGIKVHTNSAIATAVNAHSRVIIERHERSFTDQNPASVVDCLAELVDECSQDFAAQGLAAPTAVGIALAGHVQGDATVTFSPFLHWEKPVDLAAMVTAATGLPAGVFNDIDSLLVDSSWFGSGVGMNVFAIITMGVGVGYSLAVHGSPVDYPDKDYGLAGHIPIDPDGPRCSAGHVGCAQCLTTDSIAQEYSLMVGHEARFDDFARDARAGTSLATRLVSRTCFRLGTLIAIVANLAMPSTIIVAGETAFIAQLGTDSVRDGINHYRHSQCAPVRFDIMDHDWQLWAKAAASQVIVRHISPVDC
ncbi:MULTISPECIES: ROK family transcriptional regulator [Bifidobacterium]|jgi:predicted NBD/HSP70 family sugar kinase|uniref:ROK family transcriptional regulator n=1 Tax=Bifidobacterium tibiigranuli TaxID=2172043 RepID=A0A5N6S5E4_9BIFI|nr:ROK family transcriptional regulator [Bifidobacterium tibiigranuli]KAE8129564.1 ROK family transcriptional regulator [Bifidobacterium tibiigranuli]KAE8129928.1 NagC family transcriptional regulator [Bifidobacterium tibiigranuli]MCH3975719.1 ROK family transcriptional regulator [Bifidobacterium tibiigranuli]MCI1253940.1 ROK family transcriptional regulator [Bifidobacterium tibiigranuli]